jgi:hypothetical protein
VAETGSDAEVATAFDIKQDSSHWIYPPKINLNSNYKAVN